jgi:RNA polymerase sigma factor (sigma-70 family)
MKTKTLNRVIHDIRQTAFGQEGAGVADSELLECYVSQRDEGAFELLVRRHGPMVLGVCRRILHNEADAEDAFQATFLVLVRKAASIRPRGMVSNWLFGVARKTALKARIMSHKRRTREKEGATVSAPQASEEVWQQVQALLDEELDRLPEKYRIPLILCELEGNTIKEAARHLGWPQGTLATRLAQGRGMLAKRLSDHGLTLSAGALTALLCNAAASASVPAPLVITTTKAAACLGLGQMGSGLISAQVAALTEGVLKTMLVSKLLKATAVLLVAGIVALGGGVLTHALTVGEQIKAEQDNEKAPSRQADPPKEDQDDKKLTKPATDRFGDSCPEGAMLRMGTVRLRHGDGVHGVTFSPDGKILASVGGDGALRLWDSKTGKPIRQFDTSQLGSYGVAFSRDGTKLVTGDDFRNVRLWDVASGKMLLEKRGHDQHVKAVAFAPDGKTFASAGDNVCVWNTTTGAIIRNFQAPEPLTWESQGIAFSDDGKLLAASFRDKIHVWDLQRETPPLVIAKAHSPSTTSLIFADNTTLLSGGYGVVRSWNAITGKQNRELKADNGHGGSLALSADRNILAAAYWNKIKIWNHRTGEPIRDLEDFRNHFIPLAHHLALSPDGKVVAAVMHDNALRFWDVATGKRLLDFSEAHTGHVNSIVHSPDGRHVLTAGNEGTVRLWNAANGEHVRSFSFPGAEQIGEVRAAFSHNGKMIAAVGYTDSPKRRFAGACWVWDAVTGKQRHVRSFPHRARGVAFSPDDKTLAISIMNPPELDAPPESSATYLWDVQAGMEPVLFRKHFDYSEELVFLPHGKTLAGVENGALALWDIATKKQTARFGQPGDFSAAVISVDGKIAVTGALKADCFVVWDVATGQVRRRIQCEAGRFVRLALSPDGRLLASARPFNSTHTTFDASIRVWEMLTGREILRFQHGHTSVTSLAFSPDGRTLSTGMADGTALTWNVKPNFAKSLPAKGLERLWTDLASQDSAKAYQAICTLAAFPGTSLPFLGKQLQSAKPVDTKRIERLIADLDDGQFGVRAQATKELEALAEHAVPALRKALAGKPSVEVRRRLEALLDRLEAVGPSAETIREVRVVEALEWIGNAEARRLLDKLAAGPPETRLTQEAKSAARRLAK